MIKYQDYEEDFRKLNIQEDEGKIILDFLERITEIVIESYNERQ